MVQATNNEQTLNNKFSNNQINKNSRNNLSQISHRYNIPGASPYAFLPQVSHNFSFEENNDNNSEMTNKRQENLPLNENQLYHQNYEQSPSIQLPSFQSRQENNIKPDLVSNNFFPQSNANQKNPMDQNHETIKGNTNKEELKQLVMNEMKKRNLVIPQNYKNNIKDEDLKKMIDYMEKYAQINCEKIDVEENPQYTLSPDLLEAQKLKYRFPEE